MSTTTTLTYTETAAPAKYSWERGPWKLLQTPKYQTGATDQYTDVATQMVLVHNAVIRGFNSIYLQAPNVKPSEYKDFVGYSYAWYEVLNGHHDGEEELAFPRIEQELGMPGLMTPNVEQHAAFHSGFDAYASYLRSLSGRESAFSATTLISIMDSFRDALITHLNDEIPTILNLAQYGDRLNLAKIMADDGEDTMGKMSKIGALPLFLLNNDLTFEGGMHSEFPPAPKVAKWVMMHGCTWWYRGWWKFATCDSYGRPKELHCA